MQERNFVVNLPLNFSCFNFLNKIIVGYLLITLGSCDNEIREKAFQSNAVARVNDTFLYQEDLVKIIPENTSHEDSVRMVKAYIDDWVRNMLNYYNAVNHLTEDQIDVESEIQKYRNTLISYIYERELVLQKLDTVVTNKEIQEYYNENVNNLLLRDDIVRVRYIKVPKGAPELAQAKRWCTSEEEEDLEALKDYCHQYAKSFLLKDQEWIVLGNLQMELGSNLSIDVTTLEPEQL
ncbi:MAG: hypothetical protein IH948_06560, partial [Bacteroidetes bacterium]|nr:hypothetical protein [Bacteroidota bacterium]